MARLSELSKIAPMVTTITVPKWQQLSQLLNSLRAEVLIGGSGVQTGANHSGFGTGFSCHVKTWAVSFTLHCLCFGHDGPFKLVFMPGEVRGSHTGKWETICHDMIELGSYSRLRLRIRLEEGLVTVVGPTED